MKKMRNNPIFLSHQKPREIAFLDKEEVDLFQSDFRVVADFFVQKRKNGNYKPKLLLIS